MLTPKIFRHFLPSPGFFWRRTFDPGPGGGATGAEDGCDGAGRVLGEALSDVGVWRDVDADVYCPLILRSNELGAAIY